MEDNKHSITTYVSDMLALERHMRIPFEAQLKDADFNDYANAKQLVSRLTSLSEKHIDALDSALKNMGGHEASPIKSAVSQFEGMVAGMIDKARKTKVSKALRDDYTALSLCTVSYTMLHATASAMGESTVATLAQKHLEEYAHCVMSIAEAMPQIVVEELQALGLNVDTSAIAQSTEATQRAWRGGERAGGGSN
ncbi:MAG: hypothetical protein M3M96_06150 [Candidatus Eremiobacteraeota bacterium]|nr:hypothetical protein [Candidatus Eremiobacteraeota bacterium]